MARVRDWFQERIPVSGEQLRDLTNEPVPNHMKHWWFCLGGTPAFLFLLQIVTGIMLCFYYTPSTQGAYESVRYISEELAYGWYIRGLHKWGATFFIATIILHQIRIYFTSAYRMPREINWMVGMCILLCATVLVFTGYSLVYEQLSFWGATVGANYCRQCSLGGWLHEADAAGRGRLQRQYGGALFYFACGCFAHGSDVSAFYPHFYHPYSRLDRIQVQGG